MKNIVLIGFMGTGKSTISAKLKELTDMQEIDMDEQISLNEGMSIPQIFEQYGEEYFRDLESAMLKELTEQKKLIVSCGGGVVLRERNRGLMKNLGAVVLLTAKPETVFERVRYSKNRPILNGNMNVEFIKELMDKRREKYLAAAEIIIETDGKEAAEICGEILNRIEEGKPA